MHTRSFFLGKKSYTDCVPAHVLPAPPGELDQFFTALKEGRRAIEAFRTAYVAAGRDEEERARREADINRAIEAFEDSPTNRAIANKVWFQPTATIRAHLRRYDIDFDRELSVDLVKMLWGNTHRPMSEFWKSSPARTFHVLEHRLKKLNLKPPRRARSLSPAPDAEDAFVMLDDIRRIAVEGLILAMPSDPGFAVAKSPHQGFDEPGDVHQQVGDARIVESQQDVRHHAALEKIKANRERGPAPWQPPSKSKRAAAKKWQRQEIPGERGQAPEIWKARWMYGKRLGPDVDRIVHEKARELAARYRCCDIDDIRQKAYEEVLKSKPTGDPKFANASLAQLLDQRLKEYCKKESKNRRNNLPLPFEETENKPGKSVRYAPENEDDALPDAWGKSDDEESFDLGLLTPREKKMWCLAREGETQENIADILGLKGRQYTISRELDRIAEKLRPS
jgi:hypothetical protein